MTCLSGLALHCHWLLLGCVTQSMATCELGEATPDIQVDKGRNQSQNWRRIICLEHQRGQDSCYDLWTVVTPVSQETPCSCTLQLVWSQAQQSCPQLSPALVRDWPRAVYFVQILIRSSTPNRVPSWGLDLLAALSETPGLVAFQGQFLSPLFSACLFSPPV